MITLIHDVIKELLPEIPFREKDGCNVPNAAKL